MRWTPALTAILLSIGAPVSCQRKAPDWEFDLVIVNGQVVDGSGTPAFAADVAIRDDTIVRIGRLEEKERERARKLIDAQGLVVSPGFIDVHAHSDYTLLVDGTARSKITQGVTTEILGESLSAGPVQGKAKRQSPYQLNVNWKTLGEYFERLQEGGISVNVGSFVGATQVRTCLLGEDSRDPTAQEMEQMKQLVGEAMEDGALGLSSALLVPPNTYITTSQLIELATVVRPYGGIYFTHIRSEGEGIHEAVREAIEIGEKAQVPVDIIHLKIADRRLWGKMKEVCDLIENARSEALRITANQYPYIAGQNNLLALVPPWAMEGGRAEMLKRLKRPSARRRMEKDIYNGIRNWFNHYLAMGDWKGCQVASVKSAKNKQYEGKSVAEIARLSGKKPTDAVFDLLLEEDGSVPAVYFLMSEEDVRYAMRIPWVSFGSDGVAVRPDGVLGSGKPHPRWYGTFPRILGKYVREEQVLSLEEAVKKMTLLNAEKLGIPDRGLLREGKKADVTIFDPQRVMDKATFENSHQYSLGIEYVVVNGVLVLEEGR
ncbi:MAG: amidohydrolase family protein, partial [Acidobacteriota bacterium]